MVLLRLRKTMARFHRDTSGVIVVEMVIMLPLLILALAFTYEFFEVFRYNSIRDKATYVVADMISRETDSPGFIGDTYMDNSLTLFNDITADNGVNQIRVTIIRNTGTSTSGTTGYTAQWSKIRGTGTMQKLTTADIQADLARIPKIFPLEELILVDSTSSYRPTFNVGFGNNIPMASRTFTNLRVLPKLCYGPVSC